MIRLRKDSEEAYALFQKTVNQTQSIWCLFYDEDDVPFTVGSNCSDAGVIPVWSHKAYAGRALTQEFKNLGVIVLEISVQTFIESWVPNLREMGMMLGPNWDKNLAGLEVDVEDFLQHILFITSEK